MPPAGHYSIGEVLALLQDDFPDVTISKIRFLESQGLIDPERTPSGYRRFFEGDLVRLRWILVQQRDHYLPLKVIRERLQAGEPFVEGPVGAAEGNGAVAAEVTGQTSDADAVRSRDSLANRASAGAGAARHSGGASEDTASRPADATDPANDAGRAGARADEGGTAAVTTDAGGAGRGDVGSPAPTASARRSGQRHADPRRHADPPRSEAPVARPPAAGRGGGPAPAEAAGSPPRSTPSPGATPPPSEPTPAEDVASDPAAVAGATTSAGVPPEADAGPGGSTGGAPSGTSVGATIAESSGGGPAAPDAGQPAGTDGATPELAPAGPAADARGPAALAPVGRRPTVARAGHGPGPQDANTPIPQLGGPQDPRPLGPVTGGPPAATKAALSRDELAEASGCTVPVLVELEKYGLLHGRTAGTTVLYDPTAVEVARLAARLGAHGLEPRHLRSFRLSAEREVGMFAQVVAPMRRRRDPEARQQAQAAVADLVELASELHRAMVQRLVREELGSN